LLMGDAVYPEEGPVRRVTVAGFWMDRTEVTNAQFAAFVQATGHVTDAEKPLDPAQHPGLPPELLLPGAVVFMPPRDVAAATDLRAWWRYVPGAHWRQPGGPGTNIAGRENHPVVAVTDADARAYARWQGRSLPTEAQWEWAARGGASSSATPGRQAPAGANTWQGLFPVMDTADDGHAGLAPVGCYPANGYGLHDMIGNAWELTADPWTPRQAAEPDTAYRVIKGGSHLCAPNYCMRYRPGARQPQEAALGAGHVGFRTVRVAAGP
ncbi:MAG: formylglycine-generating enzyme family protein, partial [Aquabacterium sp.]